MKPSGFYVDPPSPCWGAKIKKHRNQLIYGALNDFLKAFVKSFVFVSAERQGFEPRVPRGTTVFKTAAIDHSATSPELFVRVALFFKGDAKVRIILKSANIYRLF